MRLTDPEVEALGPTGYSEWVNIDQAVDLYASAQARINWIEEVKDTHRLFSTSRGYLEAARITLEGIQEDLEVIVDDEIVEIADEVSNHLEDIAIDAMGEAI